MLEAMGAEVRIFNPSGPLPDDAPGTHPKVQALRSRYASQRAWCGVLRGGTAR